MRYYFYTILFVLWVYVVYGQQIQPVIKHYSVNEGLASSETYQCFQDSKGFIWIATNNGVSRFDGNCFRNYNMESGLPDNTVLYIAGEDKNQIVWFVSMSMDLFGIDISGKVFLHPATKEIKKHFKSGANIFPSISEEGFFYINLISDGSCLKIDKKNNASFVSRPTNPSQVNLLVTSSRFMPQINYNPDNAYKRVERVSIVASSYVKDISINKNMFANHMYRFDYCKNNLYVSAHNKIFVYDKTKLCFDSLELKGRIIDFYVDKDTNLLVSTHQNGIYYFKKSQLKTKPNRFLSIKSVGRIFQDTDGGYWIPTLNNGLYYLRSIYHASIVFKDDDQYNSVDKMASGTKDILFSVSNGKLFYFVSDSIKEIKDNQLQVGRKPIFQSMHYDKITDRYMVSIDDPSVRLVSEGKIVNKGKNSIGAFLSYTYLDKKMYIGTWTNIRVTDSELTNTTTIKGEEVKIRADALFTYSNDSILIGSMDGLYVYCPSKQIITHLSKHSTLLSNRVRQIVEYGDYLLLASKTKGIIILPKNNFNKAIHFGKEHGLASNYVFSISLYNNEIWIATNNGINRFKTIGDVLKYNKPQIYNVSDGLISNEALNVTVLDGKVFSNSNQGMSILNIRALDSIEKIKYEPKIVITEIKTDSTIFDGGKSVSLESGYDFITIGFSGIYYKDPSKVIYRYKLEGYDEEWRMTKNNFVNYSNLPPGDFNFLVAVSVNEGANWYSSSPLNLNLKPRIYQTVWFKLMIIVILILLMYRFFVIVVFRNKLRKLKKIRGQIRVNNVELKALRAQMNPHFIFNVISSIQHYILENDSKSAYKYLSTFAKLMRNVLNNSETKDVLLKDEISWLNQYIELECMRFKERFDFILSVDPKIDVNSIYMPSMILQPIIENAIKHGVSGISYKGKIEVKFEYQIDEIKISVIDNGPGIIATAKVSNEGHKSMASKIVKDRISIYNDISGFEKISIETFDLSEYNPDTTGTSVNIIIKQKATE